jgi:23S rRNA (uracil1939-C5)-methyltransferase
MTFAAENEHKAAIVAELFAHEKIQLPTWSGVTHDDRDWHYRNKMEYSFWGDEDGLHLALHQRGSHGKQIVTGSELAMPALDAGANAVLAELAKLRPRAGDLKTIIVRVSQNGDVVAALYTKLTSFTQMPLPTGVKGLRVYHSNPKSPASVPTKLLYQLGDAGLQDELLGKSFTYDADSFFQVNLPVYQQVLERIRRVVQADPVDMYAGAGSIGLSVAKQWTQLVELDPATVAMARQNFADSGLQGEVVEASAEKSLDYIASDKPVIFDPPRAGLHAKVVERCLEALPPQIIYLSCNPATQARDLALLQPAYTIEHFEVFNFFPRTPHIETLAVLTRKEQRTA